MRISRSKAGVGELRSWRVALAVGMACFANIASAQTPRSSPPTPQLANSDSTAFFRALDLEGAGKHREAAALFRAALHGPSAVSALLGLERAYHELGWTD